MDVLSSILGPQKDHSTPAIKNGKLPSDHQKAQSSFKCNACNEFFSTSADWLLHSVSHFQEKGKKEEPKESEKKEELKKNVVGKKSFKCPVCGKMYNDGKVFRNHKRNHRRNQKLGVHPFDKLGSLKLKSSVTNQENDAIPKSEVQVKNNTSSSKAVAELPSKLATSPNLLVRNMSHFQGSAVNNSNSRAFVTEEEMDMPDHTKVNMINNSTISSNVQTHSPKNLVISSSVGAHNINYNGRNAKYNDFNCSSNDDFGNVCNIAPNTSYSYSEVVPKVPVKLMINADVTANPMNCAAECITSYSYSEEVPVKLMINADVTANPMNCAAEWMPPEQVICYDEIVPEKDKLFTGEPVIPVSSSQTNQNPPTKKTSFKCNVCNKTFTKRKTFVNHKTNHIQNKKKHKFLFYDKPNKRKNAAKTKK